MGWTEDKERMMRDIKFRAWDGGDMIFFGLALCNDESSRWYFNTEVIEDYIFMQFTGLLDKEGVEIYEGDIITLEPDD